MVEKKSFEHELTRTRRRCNENTNIIIIIIIIIIFSRINFELISMTQKNYKQTHFLFYMSSDNFV